MMCRSKVSTSALLDLERHPSQVQVPSSPNTISILFFVLSVEGWRKPWEPHMSTMAASLTTFGAPAQIMKGREELMSLNMSLQGPDAATPGNQRAPSQQPSTPQQGGPASQSPTAAKCPSVEADRGSPCRQLETWPCRATLCEATMQFPWWARQSTRG